MRKIQKYGWRPDLPDHRDHTTTGWFDLVHLPLEFSLRDKMPPVYDQGELGSCTANAIGAAVEYMQNKEGEGFTTPSRLFIYYNERAIEGSVDYDSGAQIRDGIKVVATLGAPAETDWPYDISRFTEKPPDQAYTDAVKHKALKYARPKTTPYYLKSAIHHGYPVVFGFTVYNTFESPEVARTGIVPMPTGHDTPVGGHAVVATGWKEIKGRNYYEVRNSWSDGWGDEGYFWMPEDYLLPASGLASDFWLIKKES